MSRPSNEEFFEWAKIDTNVQKIRNALMAHPDLVNIKVGTIYRYNTYL